MIWGGLSHISDPDPPPNESIGGIKGPTDRFAVIIVH